jgi:hypothetical protein
MEIIPWILGILVLAVILFIVECSWVRTEPGEAMVIEKHYSPEETSTGVGYGTTSNGGSGVVVTTSHKSDEYFIFVKEGNENIKAETNMDRFLEINKGDMVNIEHYYGRLFGSYQGTWVL